MGEAEGRVEGREERKERERKRFENVTKTRDMIKKRRKGSYGKDIRTNKRTVKGTREKEKSGLDRERMDSTGKRCVIQGKDV